MLVRHPAIYLTVDDEPTHAMLVRDGNVVAVGDAAEAAVHSDERVVEPDGAVILPALCDAHIHLWGLGLRPGSISLAAATTTGAVIDALRDADPGVAEHGWVLGRDWDQHRWEDADALDIDALDALFPSHPMVLRRIDGHALWVNSVALDRAGITSGWNPGPNGHVGRRPDGRPSGLLVDDAMNPVLDVIPEPTADEDEAVFLQSCRMLQAFGCSAAHIAWMPLDRMPMLLRMREEGTLPLRLHLLLDGRDPDLEGWIERGPQFDDWLNIAGVKFFADGALGSRGAHLLEPYPDGTRGLVLETREHLRQRCPDLARRGWQVAIHAIGDAGARDVLDAYAAIDPADRRATRPRIEHCQMLTDEDVQRFAELGITASIQAIHMYSDAAWATEELTEQQLDRLFRWAELHAAAPCIAGGSDYPIEDPNPWHGISTAVSRRDRLGRTFRGEQRLALHTALASYTEGAAWSSFREDRCGRLEPGYVADFIVLEASPYECTATELWEMNVRQTWIGGELVPTD